jgi:hypothetical protein
MQDTGESESDDSIPSLEDSEDEIHYEQDSEVVESEGGAVFDTGISCIPPRPVKPDASTTFPEIFVAPRAADTPQSLFTVQNRNRTLLFYIFLSFSQTGKQHGRDKCRGD